MSSSRWLSRLARRWRGSRKPARPHGRGPVRLEALEDRRLMNASFVVTNLSGDPSKVGSLPYEVAQADASTAAASVTFQEGLSGTSTSPTPC
jgi:hypothetical protein